MLIRRPALPALAVFGPNLRQCRRFLMAATTGSPGPGDWSVAPGRARLVPETKGPDDVAAETSWQPLGLDLPMLRLRMRERVTISDDPFPPARSWALVLPAVPGSESDRDFVGDAIKALQSRPKPEGRDLLLILTDALRHLPCPAPPFDPIDAWESVQAGAPLPGPLTARAAQPASWRPVISELDRAWGTCLTQISDLAQARNIPVAALPCCAAGFLGSDDIAALHPHRTGRPFNLSVVATCLAQAATSRHPQMQKGLEL